VVLFLAPDVVVAPPPVAAAALTRESETDPLAPDKVAHAAVSYSLTLTGSLLLEKLDVPRWQAVLIAGGATFLLGLAKEYVIDAEPSGGDLAADAIGVGAGAGLVFTFEL
jgi:hypothetical protein